MKITPQNFDAVLLDYVYGELAEDMRAAFEAYVAEHRDAQDALAELQATRAALAPLAADLEPSTIVTQRVLAQAHDAAEHMALSGRLWGFFPRYATAMAALLAIAVGIVVMQPGARETGRYEVAKHESVAPEEAPPAKDAWAPNRVTGGSFADKRVGVDADAPGSGLRAATPAAPAGTAPAMKQARPEAEPADAVTFELDAPGAVAEVQIPDVSDDEVAPVTAELGRAAAEPTVAGPELERPDRQRDAGSVSGTIAPPTPPAGRERFLRNRLQYQAPISVATPQEFGESAGDDGAGRRLADAPTGQSLAPPEQMQAQERVLEESADRANEQKSAVTSAWRGPVVAGTVTDGLSEADEGASARVDRVFAELSEGRRQQQEGQHAVAIQHFQNVVLDAPAEPVAVEAQYETARSLVELNECGEALDALQDILDNAPGFPKRGEVLLAQAVCFKRLGDYRRELELYDQFAAENPMGEDQIIAQRAVAERNLAVRLKKARGAGEASVTATK